MSNSERNGHRGLSDVREVVSLSGRDAEARLCAQRSSDLPGVHGNDVQAGLGVAWSRRGHCVTYGAPAAHLHLVCEPSSGHSGPRVHTTITTTPFYR